MWCEAEGEEGLAELFQVQRHTVLCCSIQHTGYKQPWEKLHLSLSSPPPSPPPLHQGTEKKVKDKVMMWNTPWPVFCPKYSANQPVHTKPNGASETKHIHFSSFGTEPKISYLPWDLPGLYAKLCWIMTQTLTDMGFFLCDFLFG